MNANTELDLDQLHQAIIDKITAQFPDFRTVEDYGQDRKRLTTPACLIELADMEPVPEEDPGTEQLATLARFEARIIIGFRQLEAKREIRKLAAALGAFIHQQRWGKPVAPAEVTAITPDEFDPELDQFEVWRVEWQQIIHLGLNVWDGSSFPARMFVQLANKPLDPAQPVELQLEGGEVVMAEPVDPAEPGGLWREVTAPAESGVLYSHEPDTGVDHEADYDRLDGGDR
jgi:hypothetical protein